MTIRVTENVWAKSPAASLGERSNGLCLRCLDSTLCPLYDALVAIRQLGNQSSSESLGDIIGRVQTRKSLTHNANLLQLRFDGHGMVGGCDDCVCGAVI